MTGALVVNADDLGVSRGATLGILRAHREGIVTSASLAVTTPFYEHALEHCARTSPELGIGRNCVIDHAIIDKNARIGHGVVVTPQGKPDNSDGANYYIRDGIVIIPKGAVIPDGTWV